MTTLTTKSTRAAYDRASIATMVIRHVAACHVENLVESGRPLDVNYMIECCMGSIWGDAMWHDYYPRLDRNGRAAQRLLERSFNRTKVGFGVRWVLLQTPETIARFILTAEPGDLTERGVESRDHHLQHIVKHGVAAALESARVSQHLV